MAFDLHIVKPAASDKRCVLLKGPSGTGKTYQFRTLVEGGLRGLYVNVNEHYRSLDGLDFDIFQVTKYDIPLTPGERNPDKQDVIKMIMALRGDDHPYDFIFFDSLMSFSDKLVWYLKHIRNLGGYELWGEFGERMRMCLELLVGLSSPSLPKPVHVIGTWGVEKAANWEGQTSIVPLVDGKVVGPRVDYFFDDVFMLRKKLTDDGKAEFYAYTAGKEFDAKVSAGNGKFPPVIASPNLHRMLLLLQGKLLLPTTNNA